MLGSARAWVLAVLVSAAFGCSLPRGTLTTQPTVDVDAAIETRDANVPPSDASVDPSEDAAIVRDAFTPIDAACSIVPFCDGTTRVSCDGRRDCAPAGLGCVDGECVSVCTSGTTRCASGIEERCDDGSWETSTTCPIGCDGASCRAVPACTTFTPRGSLVVGSATSTLEIDLCDDTSDFSLGRGDCDDANGNEAVLTLDVPSAQMVTIDVRDADSRRAVDTLLYVRSACGDPASEVACDDDQPCDPEDGIDDACQTRSDGRYAQYGHSRVSRLFEPGRYFVFVDSYSSSSCGTVQVYATSP